jgi:two-component sensor histidine kinase
MALVHERLYKMEDLACISLTDYLKGLYGGIQHSSAKERGEVALRLDVEEIPLSLDRAIPFGLLANELISNSLKHAFPGGRRGTIGVSIHRTGAGTSIVVEDDGVGLPENFESRMRNSMGLTLASSLAHQLGGRLEFKGTRGCRVEAELTRI